MNKLLCKNFQNIHRIKLYKSGLCKSSAEVGTYGSNFEKTAL